MNAPEEDRQSDNTKAAGSENAYDPRAEKNEDGIEWIYNDALINI